MTSKFKETRAHRATKHFYVAHGSASRDANGVEICSITTKVLDGVLEIEIDIDGIVKELGARAIFSKGKKSVDGYVTVRAHSIKAVA